MMKNLLLAILLVASSMAYSQITDQNLTVLSTPLFNKATLCLEAKSYRKAINLYSQALAYYSEHPDSHYGKAVSYYYLKDMDSASISIMEALKRDQSQANFHYYAGAINYEKGKYSEALKCYQNAVALNDQSTVKIDVENATFQIGVCFMKIESHYEAIRLFADIIKKDPMDYKAVLNRGISYANIKEYTKACDDFAEAAMMGNDRAIEFLERYCYKMQFGSK
jgi:tetratricopeptide (TPR) repeat protein